MALKAGTTADFANSMAEAMENALMQEYEILKEEELPGMGRDDRRMLLVAIAQGVVRHLNDHLDAFRLDVVATQSTPFPIESDITGAVATQVGDPIECSGTATVTSLSTTGVLY